MMAQHGCKAGSGGNSEESACGSTSDCAEKCTTDSGGSNRNRKRRYGRRKQPFPKLTPKQQALVQAHLGLVGLHLRKRVPTPKQPRREREYEDLFQEGCIALAVAASRYRPGSHGPFAAYALPRIRGAVFAALTDQFTMIHIPARAAAKARESKQHGVETLPTCQQTEHLADMPTAQTREAIQSYESDQETIRHRIRERYERAVDRGLQEMRQRKWRRRDPCQIMTRMAEERLLIDRDENRTPLRQIARDFNISSGRASAYEKQLSLKVQAEFEADAQVTTLLQLARQDPAGLDAILTDAHRDELERARVEAFRQEFSRLDRRLQTELLYQMVEYTSLDVTEVASNLYRITRLEPTALLARSA
jgi:RNA polymerase sigma factor (sigma-70 family)